MSPQILQVHDPRPPQGTRVAIAPRLSTLARKKILLFDNGKLDKRFGWEFALMFSVLETVFVSDFRVGSVVRFEEYLLPATQARLLEIADAVEALAPDGVVFALLDAGIAQPTIALAIELESRGIPTSSVCYGPGAQVAADSAAPLIDAVPLQTMTVLRTAGSVELTAEAVRLVPEVLEALTGTPEQIKRRFDGGRLVATSAVPGGILEIQADDPTMEFTRLMFESGIGDGFPLACPTVDRVQSLLRDGGLDPDAEVWPVVAPRRTPLTVGEVAVIAAMCGASAEWMPLVLAAFRAMAAPEFHLSLAAISGNPAGTLVLISGREAMNRGVAYRNGAMGPGNLANASIGRAISLSYSVALRSRIGAANPCLQGSPSKYSFCCAENLDESPWPGLHTDLADSHSTTVTVLKCDGPRTVLENLSKTPEGLLRTFASALTSIASNNAYAPHAQIVVFMNPEHAQIVHSGGWSKRDAQMFLYETARNDASLLEGRGYVPERAPWMSRLSAIPVVERPEDILIAVVGAPGNLSQVSLPWGFSRGATRTAQF